MLTPHKYKVARTLGSTSYLPPLSFFCVFSTQKRVLILADVYICTGFDQFAHPAWNIRIQSVFSISVQYQTLVPFVPFFFSRERNSKVIVELLLSGKYWPRECIRLLFISRVDDLGHHGIGLNSVFRGNAISLD